MEIVEHLVCELGVSAKQAEGGAGLLLGLVQQRLSSEEFVRVADVIPAISDVIGKAPRVPEGQPGRLRVLFSRWFGGLGGLTGLAGGFKNLGFERPLIGKFVETLIEFLREKGGDDVAALLHGALR